MAVWRGNWRNLAEYMGKMPQNRWISQRILELGCAAGVVFLSPLARPAMAGSAATATEVAKGVGVKVLSLDDLRAYQGKMKSSDAIAVDFVQSKYSATRHKTSKREGRAVFLKPNLFKWMLETPTREYKIYDGQHLYDFNPDTNSATRYAPNGAQGEELRRIIDLVLNFDALFKRYDLVKAEEGDAMVKIWLKPKTDKGASEVASIEMRLDAKQEYISYLKMVMKNGNALLHEFRNPSRKPLPEGTFSLPPGAKITDSN